MLAQLEDRGACLRNRHAARFQRDPLPVLGRDRPVDVDLGAAVGAEVDVVHAAERPLELRSADRPLEMEVETRTLGRWRLTCQHGVGRGAVLDHLRDLRPVLVDQCSGIDGVHRSLRSTPAPPVWPAYRWAYGW